MQATRFVTSAEIVNACEQIANRCKQNKCSWFKQVELETLAIPATLCATDIIDGGYFSNNPEQPICNLSLQYDPYSAQLGIACEASDNYLETDNMCSNDEIDNQAVATIWLQLVQKFA